MIRTMETNNKIKAIELHLAKNPLDFKAWVKLFDEYERLFLDNVQKKYPRSIIRSPVADLIASGHLTGVGGSVPAYWDWSIYDWNGKQIQPKKTNK